MWPKKILAKQSSYAKRASADAVGEGSGHICKHAKPLRKSNNPSTPILPSGHAPPVHREVFPLRPAGLWQVFPTSSEPRERTSGEGPLDLSSPYPQNLNTSILIIDHPIDN
ncbi:hypothetical protein D7Z94_22495 [Ulvibacterium marinum]|uniref:Uncharacterized protein n=1 Tax=Ulvibacterium marinum TaxID=2419782 RepID=A0A3B0C1B0_9FLAO|nr:hypothetical protein D7Z94_22495 [Ulvibacterium marinum]